MDFGFSPEQELLRAQARKFLDDNAGLDEVRKIVETPEGFSRELWTRMAELGWLGLTVPEAFGGVGMGFVTLVVLLEETGRSLFPSPLLSTVLAIQAIERAGSEEQKQRWLPGLAAGERIGTLALLEEAGGIGPSSVRLQGKPDGDERVLSGTKLLVPDSDSADLYVVAYRSGSAPEALSLAVLEREQPGLSSFAYESMDTTKRTGKLELTGVRVATDQVLGDEGRAGPTLSWLTDVGATLVTAEAVGAAEAALALTAEYARERVQFGSPIGRFQGVKHPLAEMFVDIESFKSLVYYAAWCLDEGDPEASIAASRAKAYAADAVARIGIDGVQLHGGVGFTMEYDIQMYLKRSKWARPAFGDADYHYERIAQGGAL